MHVAYNGREQTLSQIRALSTTTLAALVCTFRGCSYLHDSPEAIEALRQDFLKLVDGWQQFPLSRNYEGDWVRAWRDYARYVQASTDNKGGVARRLGFEPEAAEMPAAF